MRESKISKKLNSHNSKKNSIDFPSLVLFLGLPSTGKTTLAEQLQQNYCDTYVHLNTDVIRKDLFEIEGHHYLDFNSKTYSKENRTLVYNALLLILDLLLSKSISVIVDGTFTSLLHREKLFKIAENNNAHLYVIETICKPKIVKKRIEQRMENGTSQSDARYIIYQKHKDIFEPIKIDHLTVDTERNMNNILQEVHNYIKRI